MPSPWRACHGCACGAHGFAPFSNLFGCAPNWLHCSGFAPVCVSVAAPDRTSGSAPGRHRRAATARSMAAKLGFRSGPHDNATCPPFYAAADLKTRAAPSRGRRIRPQIQGSMTDAAPRLACNAHPLRRYHAAEVGASGRGGAPVVLRPRTDQPSTPCTSRRPCRADARNRAAHRSSRLNDQAHADRRHARGRDPRGGAGR